MRPVWGHVEAIFEPSLGHLGAISGLPGHLGAKSEPEWAILGRFGTSWRNLGAILGHLGAILGHLGAILGPSWDHLGASWGCSAAKCSPRAKILIF